MEPLCAIISDFHGYNNSSCDIIIILYTVRIAYAWPEWHALSIDAHAPHAEMRDCDRQASALYITITLLSSNSAVAKSILFEEAVILYAHANKTA